MIEKQTYDLIIGLGKSGLSMARFLHSIGRTVVVTDINPQKEKDAVELESLGIKTQIGFHDQTTFNQAERMIPSPGIPLTNPYIKKALESGVTVKSELDIFHEHNRLPVVAITGTNGKTTTTTLLGKMLSASGFKPFVCGNIGLPLVELLISDQKFDIVVAEISSFQIDISNQFRPDIGVLLNISDDHLDRYKNFEEYENSKWRLFEYQTDQDKAVINLSIPNAGVKSQTLKAKVLNFSSEKSHHKLCHAKILNRCIEIRNKQKTHIIETENLKGLSGVHNHENTAAALLAGLSAGAELPAMESAAQNFKTLAHRTQFVRKINEISFYNDSKATNIDAVIRAIRQFETNIILILGGRGKGTDFTQLLKDVKQSVKSIIGLGENKSTIKEVFEDHCSTITADTMRQAVDKAFSIAVTGDIVLLSPACASFDMYENYMQRGNDFCNEVERLNREKI